MFGYVVAIVAIIGCILYVYKKNDSFKLYTKIIRTLPDMSFIIDKSFRILEINNLYPHLLSLPVEKLKYSDIRDCQNAAFITLINEGIQHVQQSGKFYKTEYILESEEKKRYFECSFIPLPSNRFFGLVRDITIFRQAEILGNQEQLLLNEILDNLPIPIMLKDIENDFRYLVWNRECDSQSGLNRKEVLGKTDIEIYGPERGSKYQETNQKVIDEGKPYYQQEIYVTPDGKEHTSIVTKNIISNDYHKWLLVSRWDISDLVETQHRLEQLNQMNELILNNTQAGLIYIDTQYIVKWENVSKFSRNRLARGYKKGVVCYRAVKHLDQPCEGCILTKAFKTGRVEKNELSLEGSFFELTVTPVGEKGELQGAVMKVEDISEKKRVALELQKAKEEAEKSDRLKSAFLANMSHEIRTPLNSILGFSELLAATDDPEEKKEYVSVIENNNELLLQLINDILDLSKIEANVLEFVYSDVDVNRLFQELKTTTLFKITGRNSLCIEFIPGLPECVIHTDKNRLLQILSNFVNNALKFTEKGQITFGYKILDNQDLYFYVSDTGTGIPENHQQEIFNRFIKLDSFKTGTGLGLAICQMLIKKLGGQIGVESEWGKGSTFWFTLPADVLSHI